jgi:hypothetical protein
MTPSTTEPNPEKEALWRGRVAAQAASGLTIRIWCQQAGYSDSLFHYWKSTLAKRDGTYTPPPPRRVPATPKTPAALTPAPAFARVVVAAAPPTPARSANAPASAAATAIEIVLPGLRVVRVHAGFDAAALSRVLDLLEERPC